MRTIHCQDTYKINTFADMPATWKACVPSPAYVGKFYYIDRLQVNGVCLGLDILSQ